MPRSRAKDMLPAAVARGRKPTRRKKAKGPAEKRLSRVRKPDELSLEQWQVGLRRQFGQEQKFRLKNLGSEPIFSEFEVTNPQSGGTYRVAIRGAALGENFCSCPDFAVNTLGTCKHIEFTLARLGRRRADKLALAAGYHPPFSEVCLQYGAQRRVVFRAGRECPTALKDYAQRFFDSSGILKPEAFAEFPQFLKRAQAGEHEVRCYDDALAFVAQVRDQATLAERVGAAFPSGIRSAAFRKLLKVDLYPYQRIGALFAARAGRCLIADDMGLGKTIQAIAAAEILAETRGIERVLVVSPTSLKYQWKREIEKFAGRDAIVVEGLAPQRALSYRADSFYKLTNYDVVSRDLKLIRAWEPELIVLDEAQRIKNWKTRTAQAVKQLESPYAFVLTGTPLENRLEELYSIVEFVDRFRLGPMFRFLDEHQHVDESGRVVGYRNLSNISRTLEPILIRRTKDEVLPELPERMEKRLFVPMTEEQMSHHEENRATVARIAAKWRKYRFLSEADQRRLMIALQNMRMACNSTYLLDQESDHGVKADEAIDLLADLLEDPQTKVVVFSQWVRMHELMARRLQQRNWEHVMFHGGVPGAKRKSLIQRFKDDPACRLFLSTDAGGVGLNLQHAAAVVILDQPWNPAVLEQRIGRVHRLGQHRPVRVVHLIAQGTIEEGMLSLLQFKTAMFAGVLDGGKDEVFLGGSRLKRFMESVETATGSIPAAMPPEQRNGKDARAEPQGAAGQAAPAEQLWTDVVSAGVALLDKLGQALAAKPGESSRPGGLALPPSLIARDDQTGQPYLRLPLPEPDALQKIADVFAALAKRR